MNKIHNADAQIILPTIPDNSIDLILTDPPYNTTSLKLDKQSFDLSLYMVEFKRVLKPNGWLFCFGSLEIGALLLNHFRFKFQYVWEKHPVVAHHNAVQPMITHENIWVVRQHELKKMADLYMNKKLLRTFGTPYNMTRSSKPTEFRSTHGRHVNKVSTTVNTGYREGTTILRFPNKPFMKKPERTPHPTQKPLELCQLIIRAYCKSSGTVLDPFMGSGTTPLAAKTTGRQCIGIEINPKYYKMAHNRIHGTL